MFDIGQYLQDGRKYYIYGTREIGEYLYSKIEGQWGSEAVEGFLETSPTIVECNGKRVYALSQVAGLDFDEDTYFLLAAANAYEDMRQNLVKRGIQNDRIITLKEMYPYFKNIRLYKGGQIQKVCFWPPIKEGDTGIQKKISWFLPERANVTVWCDHLMKSAFNENVSIAQLEECEKYFEESDVIYVWDVTEDFGSVEKYIDKIYVADPNFYKYVETNNYSSLYYMSLSETDKEQVLCRSKQLFEGLKRENKEKRANIFCTGPTIEEIYAMKFDPAFNIITNSLVKDRKLLERIRPRILVFDDLNFYVSPHKYGEKFYEDVLDAVRRYDMYIVTFLLRVPLIAAHFPELENKIIGIPFDASQYCFPSQEKFCTKNTSNILTELILPVASALCDEIGIAGCTGRKPDESYYWKHNPDTQYLDLMQSVFDMYPSVFRDQRYGNYYEKHCRNVEGLLSYGEGFGKRYINLTTSFIPALQKRS